MDISAGLWSFWDRVALFSYGKMGRRPNWAYLGKYGKFVVDVVAVGQLCNMIYQKEVVKESRIINNNGYA